MTPGSRWLAGLTAVLALVMLGGCVGPVSGDAATRHYGRLANARPEVRSRALRQLNDELAKTAYWKHGVKEEDRREAARGADLVAPFLLSEDPEDRVEALGVLRRMSWIFDPLDSQVVSRHAEAYARRLLAQRDLGLEEQEFMPTLLDDAVDLVVASGPTSARRELLQAIWDDPALTRAATVRDNPWWGGAQVVQDQAWVVLALWSEGAGDASRMSAAARSDRARELREKRDAERRAARAAKALSTEELRLEGSAGGR